MTTVCVARLKKELKKLQKNPNIYFETIPIKKDIRTWHYVLKGPSETDYAQGFYHGVLKFPSDYPYKPPSIMLFTPNGRFQINTKICLSNSDFHPESWSPFWSVSNILTGFVSFMTEESHGMGSISSNSYHRKLLAKQSLQFNCKNPQFRQLFPKYYEKFKSQIIMSTQQQFEQQQQQQQKPDISTNSNRNSGGRDKIFDWLVITLMIMVLAYGWKSFF